MKHAIAYWLIPAEPAREFFSRTIAELAARFDAPIFAPHLTVLAAAENGHSPADALRRVGDVTLLLAPLAIRHSDQFTKTLFVEFEKSKPLQELVDEICKLTRTAQRQVIDPHLSLLYKYLPQETKRDLAETIHLPAEEIVFNSIRAIRCPSPTQTAADVYAWKVLALDQGGSG